MTRRHIRGTLRDDGTLLLVEPFADDELEDNLTPVDRLYDGASVVICTPHSMIEAPWTVLGAQAGEARLTEILHEQVHPGPPGRGDAVQPDPGVRTSRSAERDAALAGRYPPACRAHPPRHPAPGEAFGDARPSSGPGCDSLRRPSVLS